MHFYRRVGLRRPLWSITHGNDHVYLYRNDRLVATVVKQGQRWIVRRPGKESVGPVDNFESWQSAVDFIKEAVANAEIPRP
jgi:hypothetical protein